MNDSKEAELVAKLRSETPGVATVTHFNSAGSSLPPKVVTDSQKAFLDLETRLGGYEAVAQQAQALEYTYEAVAVLINARADEIAIVQSATTAWSQVFYGLEFREGDRILTSFAEYGSNFIAFLQVAKQKRLDIEVIAETQGGDIDVPMLERTIVDGERAPVLIAITHIATSSGRVYDVAAVGAVARQYGIPFLLDACQSIGHVPIDVQEVGCDWLSASARKYLRGPRGIGFLYASREAMQWAEPAMLDVRGAVWTGREDYTLDPTAKRYEFYEKSYAAQLALGVAVQYALDLGMEWVWARIQTLGAMLRSRLRAVPGVRIIDHGDVLCGIVGFSKEGVDPAEAVATLRKLHSINIWQTGRCMTLLDYGKRNLPEKTLRASVHYYNTPEEIGKLVAAVAGLQATGVVDAGPHTAMSLLLGQSCMGPRRK